MNRIKTLNEYSESYAKSIQNRDAFWSEIAHSFQWRKPWSSVCEGSMEAGSYSWFNAGELNITENLLDRHLTEKGNQVALIWEPNDHSVEYRKFTYNELHNEVCLVAEMLRTLGVKERRPRLYLHEHGA